MDIERNGLDALINMVKEREQAAGVVWASEALLLATEVESLRKQLAEAQDETRKLDSILGEMGYWDGVPKDES